MEEINNFQQEPDETLYQAWERFKELLMKAAILTKTVADAKTAIQEMAEYSQKWHNGTSRRRSTETSDGLAAIQAQLNNLGREIKKVNKKVYVAQNSTPLYKARQMTVPFPSRLDNHYYEEKGNYGPKFTEACEASHINNAIPQKEKDPGSFTLPCCKLVHTRLTVELADRIVKYPKGIAKNILVGIGKFTFPIDFIILDMPEDIKVPLILGRPFLSTAHAKIDVYKRKFTLRVGEEKIIFKSVKPASSIIKRVYMLSLRERMELDLEARLMGETLVINRSLDPFLEDYIELNDLNEPFELRRNQGNDLMPTIEEGEVIEEFRTRNEDLDTGIDDYPSYCDDDKKIHIDCAHNLKFSCMIGFEFTHANFFPLLYVNMMSRKFHNSIMKNKMVYKGNNVVGALMNVPIFVGTFSVMTDFAVLENMDAYRDEGMGDVIFGEPFLREADIKAKRFEGMITLYKGDDEVTYQMVRSHPRFKHHTNEQCNKIPPLLKVNEKDMRFKTYDDYKDDWIYEWNKDVPWVDEKPWTDTGVWTEPKPVIHTCKPFNYKTGCSEWPTCSWMNDGYCNGGNLPGTFIIENQLHYQDYEWYEALEDSELKDEALRNKAIMEGFIKDDDDESSYEQMRRWDIYTNYDDTYKTNHDDNEREELCEVHEPLVCTIQRFEMIKYSFGQDEEYVAIKEDEYDNLARTSNNTCRTYQEIFRMMDEGWMVTRAE
ncbi:reverse transcriptase domain-containing protein [Tanacetum coccineum]